MPTPALKPTRKPAKTDWPEAENIRAKVNAAMRDMAKSELGMSGPFDTRHSSFGITPDPACGSGGMFASSARFVAEHMKYPAAELSIHGVEKTDETRGVCRMVPVRKDLAVHGRESGIRQGRRDQQLP